MELKSLRERAVGGENGYKWQRSSLVQERVDRLWLWIELLQVVKIRI